MYELGWVFDKQRRDREPPQDVRENNAQARTGDDNLEHGRAGPFLPHQALCTV
jgi:hypothetical protein